MRKLTELRVVAALMLTLSLVVSGAASVYVSAQQEDINFTVTVFDSETEQALEGAQVAVADSAGNQVIESTGPDGIASFALAEGPVSVVASLDPYVPSEVESQAPGEVGIPLTPLDAEPNLGVTVVDIVTDAPLAGVPVTVTDSVGDEITLETAEDGSAAFDIAEGPYTAVANAVGYEVGEAEGEAPDSLNFLLQPDDAEGPATVLVQDEDGAPIAGATVTTAAEITETTGEDGVATFVGLTEGAFPVLVSADGYEDGSGELIVAADGTGETTITLSAVADEATPEPDDPPADPGVPPTDPDVVPVDTYSAMIAEGTCLDGTGTTVLELGDFQDDYSYALDNQSEDTGFVGPDVGTTLVIDEELAIPFSTLANQEAPHSVVIDGDGVDVACGTIGGLLVDDELVVPLSSTEAVDTELDIVGVAVFEGDFIEEDMDEVDVQVYLYEDALVGVVVEEAPVDVPMDELVPGAPPVDDAIDDDVDVTDPPPATPDPDNGVPPATPPTDDDNDVVDPPATPDPDNGVPPATPPTDDDDDVIDPPATPEPDNGAPLATPPTGDDVTDPAGATPEPVNGAPLATPPADDDDDDDNGGNGL